MYWGVQWNLSKTIACGLVPTDLQYTPHGACTVVVVGDKVSENDVK